MRSQAIPTGTPQWRNQIQKDEDDLVRELLEADDVDNVLARLENAAYKRMFPTLRTLTSFDSGATAMEAPWSPNSATTAGTAPPPSSDRTRPTAAAPTTTTTTTARRPAGRGAPPPPPPPPGGSASDAAEPAVCNVTSPLTIPTAWMSNSRPSRRNSQHTTTTMTTRDVGAVGARSSPPPPPFPSAPRGAQPVTPPLDSLYASPAADDHANHETHGSHRDGSPAPVKPSTNVAAAVGSGGGGGAHVYVDGVDPDLISTYHGKDGTQLVPRFSTQTRSASALGLYGNNDEDECGLEDPAQGRIARQLQLLRNYRELADLCAKTSDPSASLFGAITPEALARQQADQISAKHHGVPVTVHNNYFFGSDSPPRGGAPPSASQRHAHGGGSGGKPRTGTRSSSHSMSRRPSMGLADEYTYPHSHAESPTNMNGAGGEGRHRMLPPPPPPPVRRSSSAQPSQGDWVSGAAFTSHGTASEISFAGRDEPSATSNAYTPTSPSVPLGVSQRRPPPPPPPPLHAQQQTAQSVPIVAYTSLPDSPMAMPIAGGHRPSHSAVPTLGGHTNNTQHSPSRSQRSRSRRLQAQRDVSSTATTEEAGSFDDEEGDEDAYPGDFLDADDGEFAEDYQYSEDPAPAPRIIEREQHRRPQRDGGEVGTTNYTNGVTPTQHVAGRGGPEDRSRHLDDDGEPLPQEPFVGYSTVGTISDGINTIIDKGSSESAHRGTGSGDRPTAATPESATRSVSRINVLSGQDTLEAEAPASHTRRASAVPSMSSGLHNAGGPAGEGDPMAGSISGGPIANASGGAGGGGWPRVSDDLDTEDADRDVELRPDALSGSPVDLTQPMSRGGKRRASGSSGMTPEKQRQRRQGGGGRAGSFDDDTPGNPQLQTRDPHAARRRREMQQQQHTRVPASRSQPRHHRPSEYDDFGYDDDEFRNERGGDGGLNRRRRDYNGSPRSRSGQQPSWYSDGYGDDGRGRESYSSGYSSYSSEGSIDAYVPSTHARMATMGAADSNRRRPAGSRARAQAQLRRGGPLSGGMPAPVPTPQERSGTRARPGSSGSPTAGGEGSSARRASSTSGPLASGRGGRGGRGRSPGAEARGRGRGRGRAGVAGRSVSPPELSPRDVATPSRGRGGARGATSGPRGGRGRGRGGSPSPVRRQLQLPDGRVVSSPAARSTASTPVWKQVDSATSTPRNTFKTQTATTAGAPRVGIPPHSGYGRPPVRSAGPMNAGAAATPANQQRARSPSAVHVQPGLLYGSLLPTASPRTAFVVDDPYSLMNNAASAEAMMRQRYQVQQGLVAASVGSRVMGDGLVGYSASSPPRLMDPGSIGNTPQRAMGPGNTVSPQQPGNMAVVGDSRTPEPLVWKSGSSAAVMGRNWHVPSAPHSAQEGSQRGSVARPLANPSAGNRMNMSQDTTLGGAVGQGRAGASPVPQTPLQAPQQQQQRVPASNPSVTIQVPTNYRMPVATTAGADRQRRESLGGMSSLALGASAATPTQSALMRNGSPAQRFGIVPLAS